MTQFQRLNPNWNAQPNTPYPKVVIEGADLLLSFGMNCYEYNYKDGDVGILRFTGCTRYRLGGTNDEGWYLGQCRFSKLAPSWGEFYEVSGHLRLDKCASDWVEMGPGASSTRHFLFYFRDETFECDAMEWELTVVKATS